MDPTNTKQSNTNYIKSIKSKYILKQIFINIKQLKFLKLIRYNKNIQDKLQITLNDYKYFYKIIIEIIPKKINYIYSYNFIKITDENDISRFHIYFNDCKTEIKRCYFTPNDNVSKIKILIDENIKSLKGLFSNCNLNEKINFISFNRNNITDMSFMFDGYLS